MKWRKQRVNQNSRLDVAALDSGGLPITDLTESDFHFFDNGKRQKVVGTSEFPQEGTTFSARPVTSIRTRLAAHFP